MKKVRAYITVDLKVDDEYSDEDVKTLIAVGKYAECIGGEVIMPKDEDFEVEEYVNIEIGEIERRTIK
jgi:hypothetical protein